MDKREERLSDPSLWLRRARGHRYLANILHETYWRQARETRPRNLAQISEDVALISGIAYHWGMALELAVKGTIAKKRAPALKHMTRNLTLLVEALGRKLSSDEQDLAERLVDAVWWWGRYPFSSKGLDGETGERSLKPNDRQIIEALLHELGATSSIG